MSRPTPGVPYSLQTLPDKFYISVGGRYWLVEYEDYLALLQRRAQGERLDHKAVPERYTPHTLSLVPGFTRARLAHVDRALDLDSLTPEEAQAFLAQ